MKIVQVPMEEREAQQLATLAKSLHISRADLIRRACLKYVDQIREAELDKEYARGYRETPDDGAVGLASASLAPFFLGQEDWES